MNSKLKVLKFDLGNTVTDVTNMSSSTKSNAGRAERKIRLREKYVGTGKLKIATDAKLWGFVIKAAKSDLDYQWKTVKSIMAKLQKVQGDSK